MNCGHIMFESGCLNCESRQIAMRRNVEWQKKIDSRVDLAFWLIFITLVIDILVLIWG